MLQEFLNTCCFLSEDEKKSFEKRLTPIFNDLEEKQAQFEKQQRKIDYAVAEQKTKEVLSLLVKEFELEGNNLDRWLTSGSIEFKVVQEGYLDFCQCEYHDGSTDDYEHGYGFLELAIWRNGEEAFSVWVNIPQEWENWA